MNMQKVLEFLLATPKSDRPENLIGIIEKFGSKPDAYGKFVCGTNGKLYATCADVFVEVGAADKTDYENYGQIDTDRLFKNYTEILAGISMESLLKMSLNIYELTNAQSYAKLFNLCAQQLIELDAKKAMPIIEKRMAEVIGSGFMLNCTSYYVINTANTTYTFFAAPMKKVARFCTLLEVQIFTPIRPSFMSDSSPLPAPVSISKYRLACAEYLLNLLTED